MPSLGATRLHSAHLQTAKISLVLVTATEVSVPGLISQRSAQAQRSNTADPKPHSKQSLQPPCGLSPIILLLREIQGEIVHEHT